jgi:hypothetical protein
MDPIDLDAIVGELDFTPPNTESADPTEVTIEIDGDTPNVPTITTPQGQAEAIDAITEIVIILPVIGGIALGVATLPLSLPVQVGLGIAYAAGTSHLSGGSSEDNIKSAGASGLAGLVPTNPVNQTIIGIALSNLPDGGDNSDVQAPSSGAELNSTTGQVTQR